MRANKTVLVALSAVFGTILFLSGCTSSDQLEAPSTEPSAASGGSYAVPVNSPEISDGGRIAITGESAPAVPQSAAQSTSASNSGRPDSSGASDSVQGSHSHDYVAVETAPTCTSEGYTTYTCTCGDRYTSDYRDALGHTYGDWVTEIEPTVSADGRQCRSCIRCGHTETSVLPQLLNASQFEREVVELVNAERSQAGLAPLTEHAKLDAFAHTRSEELAVNFSHQRPDGSDPLGHVLQQGFCTAGENIAAGYSSPEAVVAGWMNSPSHRANILSADFAYIGVGCYEADGTYYWVQIFAGQ